MGKEIDLLVDYPKSKRNLTERKSAKQEDREKILSVVRQFGQEFFDGDRKYGYGGYRYIENRWTGVAKQLIKTYKLNNNSKILDVGCGKGYLLYEIKKLLNDIDITGIDISRHGIKNSHPKIKKYLHFYDIRKKLKFKKKQFDLVISLGTLHNLENFSLSLALKEINRVSKPGRRVYSSVKGMNLVKNGLGISILSTPKGVMSDRSARTNNVGGEILCVVF